MALLRLSCSSHSYFNLSNRTSYLLRTPSIFRKETTGNLDDDSTATMSLHNLWRCFIDILADDSIGDVYVVINNIHLLE
ncbi:hypothetical protein BDP55DRAFT_646530 [Colletotrichum godetiae]|uniref:Uncharacterized protein n=1 Tax=Colletotrichum godetiae TaxID=1209918 RepID=A0AAJ0F380_9PEZI|nr:uncharacterized protein BDP55DRAFT_646530 [Colletotrichum godetiae]KAK1691273.1 hypothetical protein BDP55DRAFT_646530 [Colletotrichum godetiae]